MAWRFLNRFSVAPLSRGVGVSPTDGLVGGALRSGFGSALGHLDAAARHARGADRHPMAPSAVRVERSHSNRAGEQSDQTAVTMWFGESPGLPGLITAGPALRSATRVGAGILGAAAIAAATTYVTRRDQQRLLMRQRTAAGVPAIEPGGPAPRGRRLGGSPAPADVVDQ